MNKDAELFILTGIEELKAAEILLKKSLYPQSIYFIQQSIEKVAKGVLLQNEIADVEELSKKIKHEVSKIFNREKKNIDKKVKLEIEKRVIPIFEKIKALENEHEYNEYLFNKKFSLIEIINNLKIKTLDDPKLSKIDFEGESFNALIQSLINVYKPTVIRFYIALQKLFALNELFESNISSYRYPQNSLAPHQRYNKDNEVCRSLYKVIAELNNIFYIISNYESMGKIISAKIFNSAT